MTFGIFGKIKWHEGKQNLLLQSRKKSVSCSTTHLSFSTDVFYIIPLLTNMKKQLFSKFVCALHHGQDICGLGELFLYQLLSAFPLYLDICFVAVNEKK